MTGVGLATAGLIFRSGIGAYEDLRSRDLAQSLGVEVGKFPGNGIGGEKRGVVEGVGLLSLYGMGPLGGFVEGKVAALGCFCFVLAAGDLAGLHRTFPNFISQGL